MVDPGPLPSDVRSAPEPLPDQPDIAAMRRLVQDAFSAKELYRFCKDRPDFREACDRVREPPSLDDMADALLDFCEKRLRLLKLLEEIWKVNHSQAERYFPELRYRAPVQTPREPSYPPPGGYSQPVKRGLRALVELVQQNPAARKAVIEFGTDFRAARQRIDELFECKFLHDQLHELEVRCYTPIITEQSRFPHSDGVVETFSYHEFDLQRITDALGKFIEQTDCKMDISWVKTIGKAQKSLREATSKRDAHKLNLALGQLRSVLIGQPTRINERLLTTARLLRLPTLVAAMRCVSDSFADLDLDPEKVNEFEVGVEALADLERSLPTLVADHDQWQRLDLEMRQIEAFMQKDTKELEMFWPHLKAMTEPLHQGRSEDWATRFRKSIDDLDSAIADENPNPNRIGDCFRKFRWHASCRFYEVDTELKKGCEVLREVGEPMASVLRWLE